VLLYCGDHDPAGLRISKALMDNLTELTNAVGWNPRNLHIDRFGLNYDFIVENNLTWIDNLVTGSGKRLDDPKHKDHKKAYVQDYIRKYGVRKVEANALVARPEAGRALCREAIGRYVPPDAIERYQAILAPWRDKLFAEIRERVGAEFGT
jgi:hypothetical protein